MSFLPGLADLRPHLSDALLSSAAPASPSSTSVSDGSGPDEFDFPEQSLLGPARTSADAAWNLKGLGRGQGQRTRDFDEETELGTYDQPPPCAAGDLLPYEIWVHIFKFLPSTRDLKTCLLVSHLWCQVGVEILWHKPTFYRLNTLYRLLDVIDPPVDMYKIDPETFIPSAPRPTFNYAQYIRRLNLMNITEGVDDRVFMRLRSCTRLERLTLQGCSKLTDDALETVLGHGNMPDIVALDLTNVKLLTDVTISAIAIGCPRLQGLNLTGCSRLTDEGVVKVAECARLLRRIKLVKCCLVTDASIIALARSCPLLLEVDLVDVQEITAAGTREIWLYSSNLRELRLSNCHQVDDQGFPYLFPPSTRKSAHSTFNSIRPLFPPSSLLPVSTDTTPLSSVASSPEPTSTEIMASQPTLVPPPNWMRSFDHLRILDLTSCALLTDQAVDAIVTNAPRIRSLVLAKCFELTDESINSICRLGRSLHQLHMGHVSCITDGAVSRLARTCTRLRYVDFACCPLLSDISVLELSQLSKLRRIGLVRVANLTDHAIHALVERPSSLERIHLSYCENISIEAIHYLLQRLRNLTHLSLTGVPAFRREDLQKFCRQPPKDFNHHQRSAFCVYSGNGVRELRNYLASIFDNAHRSEAGASSPTSSSVSISFDQDQEDTSVRHNSRISTVESPTTAPPPVAYMAGGGEEQPPATRRRSLVADRFGLFGGSSGRNQAEPASTSTTSHFEPEPQQEGGRASGNNEGGGTPSLGSRLIRLGRGYAG